MSIGYYEENAEAFVAATLGADMDAPRRRFADRLTPGARVLDAGCGSGRDALAFHRQGFQVTAFDGSARLAAMARAHTGLPIQVIAFGEVAWREAFDGVWACASLLHVSLADLPGVIGRLRDALTAGGILYASFKYGIEERQSGVRRFTDLDETRAAELIAMTGGLDLSDMWVDADVRPDRADDRWLNLICRRP